MATGANFFPDGRCRTRILHLLESIDRAAGRPPGSLFSDVAYDLRSRGFDLRADGITHFEQVVNGPCPAYPEGSVISLVLGATWRFLRTQRPFAWAGSGWMSTGHFIRQIDDILREDGAPYRLWDDDWRTVAASDAEILRRILLENEDDIAACKQGDVQVEMVVSTVQAKLARAGTVLVDYGAGLGRVLAGLASASYFKTCKYIAVEEPMPHEVETLVDMIGVDSELVSSRESFLRSDVAADVIMVVNVLHHIPFREIHRQIGGLFERLQPGGLLLVHEMGALRTPEQRNVPWRIEDLLGLFAGNAFNVNSRSTTSKSGVPLAHVLVTAEAASGISATLATNVTRVWQEMKSRAVKQVGALYDSHDADKEVELQHALFVNANLDLNQPDPQT